MVFINELKKNMCCLIHQVETKYEINQVVTCRNVNIPTRSTCEQLAQILKKKRIRDGRQVTPTIK